MNLLIAVGDDERLANFTFKAFSPSIKNHYIVAYLIGYNFIRNSENFLINTSITDILIRLLAQLFCYIRYTLHCFH